MSAQCESINYADKRRCEKDAGHDDYHWYVTESAVCAWGLDLGGHSSPAGATEGTGE